MSFDLAAYLAERKELVEKNVFACLPEVPASPETLAKAMAHALEAGGKRLRPILCLASAEAVGGNYEAAMCPACAVELLHNYTLVHDDLPCMDNDVLRRGKPTVWKKYGEVLGVLAGDALLTLAFEEISKTPESHPGLVSALVRELAVAAGACGVIGGQTEDTAYDGHPTRELIDSIFRHKTADLFQAACRMGGLCAGAEPEILARLTEYAEHLGFAFQIVDDILDAPAAHQKGERPELSCLDIMSVQEARDWAESHTKDAVAALENLPGRTEPMRELAITLLSRVQ
jgi:geranylgeranyl diphosphate synthase type II